VETAAIPAQQDAVFNSTDIELGVHNLYHEAMKSVDYKELERTHITSRSFRDPKWTPQWALDDKKVRLVVYQHVWNYVARISQRSLRPGIPLNELENLAQTLVREDYQRRKQRSYSAREIRITEAHLRHVEKGYASLMVTLIYKAYRERLKGIDIADILEMTPGAVRQILHRLNCIARNLFPAEECSKPHWTAKPATTQGQRFKATTQRWKSKHEVDDLDRELVARYNEGAILKDLAREFKMSLPTVSRRIRTSGLASPDRRNTSHFKIKVFATPEMQELAFWRKHGAGWAELGRMSGVSGQVICWRLKKLGLL
jgi:hypothetical protein